MSLIRRSIQVGYQLQVHFTQHVFDPSNPTLKTVLAGAESHPEHKALIVLDESLAQAQSGLAGRIESYFAAHSPQLKLVCPPLIIEGGERTKNSYFHVSE